MSLILHKYNDYDPDRVERDKFLKGEENPSGEGDWVKPYYDGSIAIGYGFDLLVRSTAEINSYLNKTNDALGLTGSQRVSLPLSDIPLLTAAQKGNRRMATKKISLTFPSEAYSAKLTNILLNEYESALDKALGFCLLPSKEKTAILSLLYTLTNPTATAIKIKIPSTLEAIKNNNRAEAWYEIRYGSNKGFGHTARRYREAQLFNLYNEGPININQAKEVMRMHTIHEFTETNVARKITTYELKHKPPKNVFTIDQEISDAKNCLVTSYAFGTIDGEIIIGAGLDTYAYKEKTRINDNLIGSDKGDLILGEKGNDVIHGGQGNDEIYGGEGKDHLYGDGGTDILVGGDQDDILEGGAGDDKLYGGGGDDTYIINAGDGNDTIEDKQGNNTVKLCGEVISVFWNKKKDNGDWEWINASGKLKAYKSGTDLIVEHENGMRVTLNEDFEWGDFGTSLIDVPGNPLTTNTLAGTEDANTIHGTAANDLIQGLGGDDFIDSNAGNDSIVGGSGNDLILGGAQLGDSIIEGNDGIDQLVGGTGNDRIFAGNYGEMEDLVEAGETAQGINESGEALSGGAGEDLIYASNYNDVVFGGEGHDLIVGGGGDDNIFGDYDFAYDSVNDSGTGENDADQVIAAQSDKWSVVGSVIKTAEKIETTTDLASVTCGVGCTGGLAAIPCLAVQAVNFTSGLI